MDWLWWVVVAVVAAALYVPVMAGLMAFAMWLLFTPGFWPWAGPRKTDPLEVGYRGDPKTGLGLEFEAVNVPTELGDAESWLVPAGSGGPLWAIYVHGVGGLRENGLRYVSVLHGLGIPTLMLGYRNDRWAPPGQPRFYCFGLHEWRDIEAAIDWARGCGAERFVLLAESMGAAVAGQFLKRSPAAGRVAALVLDSPALDFAAVVRHFTRWAPFGRQIEILGYRLARKILPVDLETAAAVDIVRDYPGPMFLAHGVRDPLVPVTISRTLAASRAGETAYLEFPRGVHVRSWQAEPERYREGLRQFLHKLSA